MLVNFLPALLTHKPLFFQGIGAVFLQYGLQFLVLRAINAIFNHSANALRIATSPPTVRRSGPNSGNVLGYGGPPSAQFAAAAGHAEEEKTGNPFFGHHSPGSGFPSFAQTQSAGAFGAEPTPFGPTYSTFHETGKQMLTCGQRPSSLNPFLFPGLIDEAIWKREVLFRTAFVCHFFL